MDPSQVAAAIMQAMQSMPRLSTFSGKEPVENFITELKQVHAECDYNDTNCIRLLRMSVDGQAKSFFYQCLKEDQEKMTTATVDEWITRLRSRFAKPFITSFMEMKARKMTSDETAADFVDAIVSIGKTAIPPVNDYMILEVLHQNLLPKYKHTLLVMDPDSPDAFKQKLTRAMFVKEEELDQQISLLMKATSLADSAIAGPSNSCDREWPSRSLVQASGGHASDSTANHEWHDDDDYGEDEGDQKEDDNNDEEGDDDENNDEYEDEDDVEDDVNTYDDDQVYYDE